MQCLARKLWYICCPLVQDPCIVRTSKHSSSTDVGQAQVTENSIHRILTMGQMLICWFGEIRVALELFSICKRLTDNREVNSVFVKLFLTSVYEKN